MKNLFLTNGMMILICFICSQSYSKNATGTYPCAKGTALQLKRAHELQSLAEADQKDRQNMPKDFNTQFIKQLVTRDLSRLKRVGEIFGEGCFHDAKDYLAAALIYQHGMTSDHYYQAYVWSKRAAELGDINGQTFSALAIDRYLNTIGKKQLFASQYRFNQDNQCFCMLPVEPSFPDQLRKKYSGYTKEQKYQQMAMSNHANCPKVECTIALESTPKGSVIGLW